VSTLWAVAEPAGAAVIERAHQAAVNDALALIETHALFTRPGPTASGRSTCVAWSPLRAPTATAGPATRTCTPTSQWPTRCRPSMGAGYPSTAAYCSRPTWPPQRPTTPRSSSTSATAWGCGSPNGLRQRPASWPSNSRKIMVDRRPRSKRCTWPSRQGWKPATPNTNPDPWLNNGPPGSAKRQRC
jgi:hypothetical protein